MYVFIRPTSSAHSFESQHREAGTDAVLSQNFQPNAVGSLSVYGTKSTPTSYGESTGQKNPETRPWRAFIRWADQKGLIILHSTVYSRSKLQIGLVLLEHTILAIWLARTTSMFGYMAVCYINTGACHWPQLARHNEYIPCPIYGFTGTRQYLPIHNAINSRAKLHYKQATTSTGYTTDSPRYTCSQCSSSVLCSPGHHIVRTASTS